MQSDRKTASCKYVCGLNGAFPSVHNKRSTQDNALGHCLAAENGMCLAVTLISKYVHLSAINDLGLGPMFTPRRLDQSVTGRFIDFQDSVCVTN